MVDLRTDRSSGPEATERPYFFRPVYLLGLFAAVLVAFVLLFPKHSLQRMLADSDDSSAATLSYLQMMVRAQPDALDVRLMLAERALTAGKLTLAASALGPWHSVRAEPTAASAPLQLALAVADIQTRQPGTDQRRQALDSYRLLLARLSPLLTPTAQLEQVRLAQQAGLYQSAADLAVTVLDQAEDPALAMRAYRAGIDALLAANQPAAAFDLARAHLSRVPPTAALWQTLTRLSMAADQPRQAADYARRWLAKAADGQERLQAMEAVVSAWLAAGMPERALQEATDLIGQVPESRALWRQLTRLSLQAGRPDLAAHYARRLLGEKRAEP